MNAFFFEIVQGQSDRYFWQFVTSRGGERGVLARSRRNFGSYRKACKAAKATKKAVRLAPVVRASRRGGDVRFEVLQDVLALKVTGYGDTDANTGRSVAAASPAATEVLTSTFVEALQAHARPAGTAVAQVGVAAGGHQGAPHNSEAAGKSANHVSSDPQAGGAQPKARSRKTATRSRAAAAKS